MKNRDGMKASLLYVFGVMVLVAGCGREEPSAPASAGQTPALKTLVVARASEPEWLNPVAGHQHADSDMALFRGLFKVNAKNELVPDMASSWEVSPDGKVYTLRLRPNIKWHDGVAFSAEDVKFTITAIQDPKNHSGMSKAVKEIKAVEVVDPLTVRITLDQPLAPLLSRLKMGIIPKHALQGKDFNTDPFNYTQPVGTGPFKFRVFRKSCGSFCTKFI
ncbi:MAG: hypothetical protein IDH49_15465 [Gammaproteobacteria bacterium]|nr:hypothetical protein [Gammaproteobacteria bacterium]